MKTRRSEAIWIESRHRWQINVQRDGQRKTFTDSTPGRQGKHAAEAKADKWLTKFSTEQRLGDAWTAYIDDHRAEITAQTLANLQSEIKHLFAIVPETRKLSMITLYDYQKVLDAMAADGYKAGTIKRMISAITALNRYALRRRWDCEEIREGDLQVPKQAAAAKQKQALAEDALKALYTLTDSDSPYIYLFQFLPLTGLRIGEARALRWTDIDTSAHVLHMRQAANVYNEITEGKTANAQRTIPLIPQAESILDEQRALLSRWQLQDTEYIFPTLSGELASYPAIVRHWHTIAERINTTCTIHELRHTFISISKSKLPLSLLKQVAGHSTSMDTLKVYGHETQADVNLSRDLMQEAFQGI